MAAKVKLTKQEKAEGWEIMRGVWGECIACRQNLPLHPDLEMCGTCTFGEASALMEFDGEWKQGPVNAEAPDAR